MRFLFRNFHVFVFAIVSVSLGLVVAHKPEETVRFVQPMVEEAVELQVLANTIYRDAARTDWQAVSDEALSLFVSTLRMPTSLFEQLSEQIEDAEQKMQKSAVSDPVEKVDQV